VIFLSASDTEHLVDWAAAVDAIQNAYSADFKPASVPRRVIAQDGGAWLRCMPAISPSGRYMGTKQIARSHAGRVTYLITLFDQQDASLAFVMDGLEITRIRTAATTVAAMQALGGASEMRLAVLGSGLEAQTHFAALASTRAIASVSVFSPNPANRDLFAKRAVETFGIEVRTAGSAEDAVSGATHVVAAARSRDESPILFASWLAPGVVVASIGSTIRSQRELDISVVREASVIIADEPDELAQETGDMIAAKAAGIGFTDKLYSLQQLVRQEIPGKVLSSSSLTLFKSVGTALQDLVFSELLVERARRLGIGTTLPVALLEKSTLRGR
jgi:ornithine cyclodeaminase/alanine dehydrogenase